VLVVLIAIEQMRMKRELDTNRRDASG